MTKYHISQHVTMNSKGLPEVGWMLQRGEKFLPYILPFYVWRVVFIYDTIEEAKYAKERWENVSG